MIRANPWKTPFGIAFIFGCALSALFGFVAGQAMRLPSDDYSTTLNNAVEMELDENALIEANREPVVTLPTAPTPAPEPKAAEPAPEPAASNSSAASQPAEPITVEVPPAPTTNQQE
jgi:hypothetical protein